MSTVLKTIAFLYTTPSFVQQFRSEVIGQPQTAISEVKRGGEHYKARELLQCWGKTSTSYMTLQAENHLFVEQESRAYLAYRRHLGVAITVGDPVGAPDAIEPCIHQFKDFCTRQGWLPIFFAIEDNLPLYQELGLRRFQIAEDAYLNLKELNFKGKTWQDVRTALNRAKREQIQFHRLEPGKSNPELLRQIEAISSEWLHTKKLPEPGFMLGATDSIHDPAVRTYYAANSQGQIQGFISWLPRYEAHSWALDLKRRRQGAMPGIMEFLIACSAQQFQSEGFTSLALGTAPLAPIQNQRPLSFKEQLLGKLIPFLDHFYSFSNLYNFKRKFQPEWKPLYLYYPAGFGLSRIVLALLASYLSRPNRNSSFIHST